VTFWKTNLAQTLSEADLYEMQVQIKARTNLWVYRRYMRPQMIPNWWQWDLSTHLQNFYHELIQGHRPILVIQAPPQHGKSVSVVDFIAWISGRCPYLKIGFASYSDMLGVKANLHLQRTFADNKFQALFPKLTIPTRKDRGILTRDKIEFMGTDGFFRNTTVGGAITGEPLDLGVIDDPIKGREEANSKRIREKTWDWFTDDFSTRFSEHSGLLWVMTRWHVDDPIGRFLNQDIGNVKVLKYPAIAEHDELYRKKGQALFPQHKSIDFLEERKARMASFSYEALYQQNPKVIGGNIIKGSFFRYYNVLPKLEYRNIYVDTAQKTKEANDYTVFECWGKGVDGNLYLVDLWRGKWDAVDLELNAAIFWNKHNVKDSANPDFDDALLGGLRVMKIEDKVSGTGLIQSLPKKHKIPVQAIQRNKDKYTRVCDNLGYIESGFVYLPVVSSFTQTFVTECEEFSADGNHSHDDQVDPLLDAIEDMLGSTRRTFYD
jgi:predicted phage terminase large subunit-like protein